MIATVCSLSIVYPPLSAGRQTGITHFNRPVQASDKRCTKDHRFVNPFCSVIRLPLSGCQWFNRHMNSKWNKKTWRHRDWNRKTRHQEIVCSFLPVENIKHIHCKLYIVSWNMFCLFIYQQWSCLLDEQTRQQCPGTVKYFQYVCCHYLFLSAIIHYHATVIKVGLKWVSI